MIDLLSKFGLEDRFYRTPKDLIENINVWMNPIDYSVVDNIISTMRSESRDFLINALSK